jgi:predicted ribonuclease YlaK
VRNGANFDLLFPDFVAALADAGDSEIAVRVKLDAIMNSFLEPYLDHELRPPLSMTEAAIWDELNEEQKGAAGAIMGTVLDKSAQLIFLQGSAGTGKTFLVRHLLDILRSRGIRWIMCATPGIAAV